MAEAAGSGRARRKPLSVRDNGNGTYTILDGNATYGAALRSGWSSVPVEITDGG